MKNLLLLFSMISLACSAQVTKYVLANKDTLIVSETKVTYPSNLVTKVIRPYKVVDTIIPSPSGYTLTYQSGYDKTSDITTDNGQYGKGVISTTRFKTAPGSFYSIPENVSSGIRSEVQYTGSDKNPIEGAIEWDVFYEKVIPDNGHSFQFHPNTSGGSASPGLWHVGGKFVWNNWKGGSNTSHSTGVTIKSGVWYKIRIEFKFGSNGYFKHFIDGVQVCSWTGQVGDGSGQYLKVGYNGWDGNSASSRIYYDNLKIYKKL